MMKWLALASLAVDKIPFERLLVRRPSNKERLQELETILSNSHAEPAEKPTEEPELPPEEIAEDLPPKNLGNKRPKVRLESNPSVTSTVSTKETVDYQNREIGKTLLNLQRHCVQKFRIAGRACDCGQSRHLLELEALSDEAIAMVDNPDIYYKLQAWIGRLGPICTVEKVSSGEYDDDYPIFGNEARDLRKELLGTLDPKALFPEKHALSTVNEEEERQELLSEGFTT